MQNVETKPQTYLSEAEDIAVTAAADEAIAKVPSAKADDDVCDAATNAAYGAADVIAKAILRKAILTLHMVDPAARVTALSDDAVAEAVLMEMNSLVG